MKARFSTITLGAGMLIVWGFCASAQDKKSDPLPDTNAPSKVKELKTQAVVNREQVPDSSGSEIKQVLKMLEAGVSKDVVKVYVERLPVGYLLSAGDLITLKAHSVPDEITMAMLKRGPEAPANSPPRPNMLSRKAGAEPDRSGLIQGRGVDPESYDFWWYHYAYPRALAAANQRLLSTGGWNYSGQYTYYPALPFSPQAPPPWAVRR